MAGSASADLERHAEQLAALGHPLRLEILRFVVKRGAEGAPAGEIQSHLGIPASTLSHHVDRLTKTGMLVARRDGTFIYYAPDLAALGRLTSYLWEDCCKAGQCD